MAAQAYRRVIDDVFIHNRSEIDSHAQRLIGLIDSHGFTSGFLFPDGKAMQSYGTGAVRKQRLVGVVGDINGNELRVAVKNPVSTGDSLTAISPGGAIPIRVLKITDENGEKLSMACGASRQSARFFIEGNYEHFPWSYSILVKE
jgi:hypothetical protein